MISGMLLLILLLYNMHWVGRHDSNPHRGTKSRTKLNILYSYLLLSSILTIQKTFEARARRETTISLKDLYTLATFSSSTMK